MKDSIKEKTDNKRKNAVTGSILAALTGVSWAVSGVFGQYLNQTKGIGSTWIVPYRMLSAGIALTIIVLIIRRESFLDLCRNKRDFAMSVFSGVFGLMVFQYMFFGAVQRSNAGTATVLQYLCPVITMVYCCIRDREAPRFKETACILLALFGVFLISTHGNPGELVLTPEALFWGIGSAVGMFLATVIPEKLYGRRATIDVIPVSFLAGGIVLNLIYRPWTMGVSIDAGVLIAMFFIVGAGCIAAYFFYGNAIKRIGAARSTLFSSTEPVTAALLSAAWLGTSFAPLDIVGFACILSTLFILNIGKA